MKINYKSLVALVIGAVVSIVCAVLVPFIVLGTEGMVTPFWALWIIVCALMFVGCLIGVIAWFAYTVASYYWREFYDKH